MNKIEIESGRKFFEWATMDNASDVDFIMKGKTWQLIELIF